MKTLTSIIQASELLDIIQHEKIILIDATNSPNAKENYKDKHLKGALFVDLNSQLAEIKSDFAMGGRHPLPSIQLFQKTLFDLGIQKNSHVVIYDNFNGANAASRFWWMLKSIGHENVQVLNGGFQHAEKMGFPISNEIKNVDNKEPYPIEKWNFPLVEINEVERATKDDNFLIIDVREKNRYDGKIEPIDLKAGHIPNAINVPFTTNLNSNGLFLSPNELRMKYQEIFQDRKAENIIIHCGSGVTACHSLLAIASAGIDMPNLYVGSWSEWSRNEKEIIN